MIFTAFSMIPVYLPVCLGLAAAVQGTDVCSQLASLHPNSTVLPASAQFAVEAIDNWSETCQALPSCIYEPNSAQQLAEGFAILRQANQTFALRTGGHMPVSGASNIANEVLVSTVNLNSLQYAQNKSIVQIGAGHRWLDVYSLLQNDNLAVAGGRFGPVGVSGLLLGGGISYFGSQYGWGSSTITNYEIVLANGTITEANAQQNSDLFWALKGGSSNFGIVTRFDMKTFSVDAMWGGEALYNSSALDPIVNAYASYTVAQGGSSDPRAHADPSILVNATTGEVTVYSIYMHRGSEDNPPSLQNFTDIPATFSDLRVGKTILGLSNDTNPPAFREGNLRQLFSSTAMKSSVESVLMINQTMFEAIAAAPELKNIKDLSVTNTYQLFTPGMINAALAAGGDPMGLYDPNGNGINSVLYGANWASAEDDETVYNFIQNLVDTLDSNAKQADLYYDFIYFNDGAPTQTRDVFQKFGNGTALLKMKAIAEKYDPDGVFQTLVPGGFKLSNAA